MGAGWWRSSHESVNPCGGPSVVGLMGSVKDIKASPGLSLIRT